MTDGDSAICIVCRARPTAYDDSHQCGGCFARMRGDLGSLIDVYAWLAVGMANPKPGWRTGSIHAVSTESPIPFRVELHDQREKILGALRRWAKDVGERRQLVGPLDSSINTTANWLRIQLSWCSTQYWVKDLAAELRTLRAESSLLYPWQGARQNLAAPCGNCARLTLTLYTGDDDVTCRNRECGVMYSWPDYVQIVYVWLDRVTMEARRRRGLEREPTDLDERLAVALDPSDLDDPAAIWLTTDQAAEAAHVDAGRIRGWASRGKIKPHPDDDPDAPPRYREFDVLTVEASTRRGRRELSLLGEALAAINQREHLTA